MLPALSYNTQELPALGMVVSKSFMAMSLMEFLPFHNHHEKWNKYSFFFSSLDPLSWRCCGSITIIAIVIFTMLMMIRYHRHLYFNRLDPLSWSKPRLRVALSKNCQLS